jgi:hypothetical protein
VGQQMNLTCQLSITNSFHRLPTGIKFLRCPPEFSGVS